MDPFADVLTDNARFAQTFIHDGRPGKAARGLAVITCMDSRIEPLRVLGLQPGDAKFLRNAGARVTDDVLRTLVLATHLLAVDRVMVMAHTDCRMSSVTDEQVHEELARRGLDSRSLDFQTIPDQALTLAADVQRVRSWPYLPAGLPVTGCRYDVQTGRLEVLVPA